MCRPLKIPKIFHYQHPVPTAEGTFQQLHILTTSPTNYLQHQKHPFPQHSVQTPIFITHQQPGPILEGGFQQIHLPTGTPITYLQSHQPQITQQPPDQRQPPSYLEVIQSRQQKSVQQPVQSPTFVNYPQPGIQQLQFPRGVPTTYLQSQPYLQAPEAVNHRQPGPSTEGGFQRLSLQTRSPTTYLQTQQQVPLNQPPIIEEKKPEVPKKSPKLSTVPQTLPTITETKQQEELAKEVCINYD